MDNPLIEGLAKTDKNYTVYEVMRIYQKQISFLK